MERYLQRSRLGSALDDLGLRSVIALGAMVWFCWLWGIGMPALIAGSALGILGQMTLSRYRRYSVGRREQQLRQSLGGEMLLEDMVLSSEKQAHMRAAMLLAMKYPLTIIKVEEDGALCRSGGRLLIVYCVRRSEADEATAEDALRVQRACRHHLAERGVLCLPCREGKRLLSAVEKSAVPLRIIPRETMLTLAGRASPATDEQLVALGKRKERPTPGKQLWATALHRDRAGRYMFYAMAMLTIYILTGIRWYPLPGLLLALLGAVSHYHAGREEPL